MTTSVVIRKLAGIEAYEVRRAGVLLGQVEKVDHVVTVRRESSARISKVKRWRFQVVGAMPCRSLYTTRKRAVTALSSQFDAYQRARKA